MIPQQSSPAHADLRWRDGLQAKSCTPYSIMHHKAFIKRSFRYNSPRVGYLFDRHDRWIIGPQIDDPSSLYPTLMVMGVTLLNDFPSCRGSSSKQYTRTNKQQIYNRMNGSPGDPPGTHMHNFKPKRITPFTHRLASDPTGMEAGRETLT